MKLTPKQQAFVKEYIVDLNATQAAIRAGYSEKTASETGYENLRKPQIAAAIEEAMNSRSKKTEISAEWVLNNLKEIAERCMQGIPVTDREGNETGEWKFEHSGANKSLELIGKHLGMFIDKQEVKSEHSGSIQFVSNTPDVVSADEWNKDN